MAEEKKRKRPTLLQALIPIIFLILILSVNVIFVYGEDALYGPNQIGLILSAAVAGLVCMNLGIPWIQIEKSIVRSINAAMP
ncbi:MAG: sodium:proton antiporter, partial [Cyclobacteriaceae bacterium]